MVYRRAAAYCPSSDSAAYPQSRVVHGVYSTCLFCSGALGRNEAIEQFPVGRRLAFDGDKGRLWVVCPRCARWNLTPLESRWEAIEEAERLYRGTRTRVSTGQVGLARLREGTELVRIGAPLLPEFAAWRYGDQFSKRWKRFVVMSTASVVVPLSLQALSSMSLGGAFTWSYVAYSVANIPYSMYRARKALVPITAPDGRRLYANQLDALATRILKPAPDGAWRVELTHRIMKQTGRALRTIGIHSRPAKASTISLIEGEHAHRAVSSLLALANGNGASRATVREAVALALESTDTSRLIRMRNRIGWAGSSGESTAAASALGDIPQIARLSLEIVVHEADERRAMEGELQALEDRWREAEEIAAIADRMFLPDDLDARLERLRAGETAGES